MHVVAVFDISPETELDNFRAFLKREGYFRGWNNEGIAYYLPRNSVLVVDSDPKSAKQAFLNTFNKFTESPSETNIELIRLIILPLVDWEALPGKDNEK